MEVDRTLWLASAIITMWSSSFVEWLYYAETPLLLPQEHRACARTLTEVAQTCEERMAIAA